MSVAAQSGDSRLLARQKLSAPRQVFDVEAERLAAGVSQTDLCRSAGVALRSYTRFAASGARPETVARLRKALKSLAARAPAAKGPDDSHPQVRAIFGGFLLAVAPHYGVSLPQIHAALGRAGEQTLDPHWRACSHARQAAIYLTHTALSLKQKMLADVLGLTPAAICLSIRAVEDRRDEAIFDEVLNAAEAAIMGGSA